MRVTESSFSSVFLNSVNKNRERLAQLQSQVASGKRVLKVSDDPQGTNVIMRVKNLISANDEYQKTIAHAQSLVDTTSEALSSYSDILIRIKELATKAISGGQAETRAANGEEINKLIEQAVNIANTTFEDKYIFAGTNSLEKPFILGPANVDVQKNPNGITGAIEFQINNGVRQAVTLDGENAFQGTKIFDTLIAIRNNLQGNADPTAAQLADLDSSLSYVLTQAGKTGIMSQNLQSNADFLDQQTVQLQSMLSVQQDADIAQTATEMKQSELMLEAALQMGAKIIPKSLLDFLR